MFGVAGGRVERVRFTGWEASAQGGVRIVVGIIVVIEVEEYGHDGDGWPIYE